MKLIILVTLTVAVSVARTATYTDKWDNINLDEILQSDRLLNGYMACLLDKGRCTADAKALKDTIPDALQNECSNCTAKQKEGADKVISFLINKRPALWKELGAVYDPKNIYQEKYKDKIVTKQ